MHIQTTPSVLMPLFCQSVSGLPGSGFASSRDGVGGSGGGDGRGAYPPLARREELRALLNAFPCPVLAFSPPPYFDTGQVLLTNDRTEDVLGYTPSESARLTLGQLCSSESAFILEAGLKHLIGVKATFPEPVHLKNKKGLRIAALVTLTKIMWDDSVIGFCLAQDIAGLKKAVATVERWAEGWQIEPLIYNSFTAFDSHIRDSESELHRRLRFPQRDLPVVEVRIVPTHRTADRNLSNQTATTRMMLLNIATKDSVIPEGKQLKVFVHEGESIEPKLLMDVARRNREFREI